MTGLLDLQETTNVYLVTDDNEILETTSKENIPWIDSVMIRDCCN